MARPVTALDHEEDRRVGVTVLLETLALALVLFPASVAAVAIAAFAVGRGLGGWMLAPAALLTLIGLRACSTSWSAAARMAAIAAAVHVGAALFALAIPDGTWDGLAYQQEGLLRLVAGWNPLYQDASLYGLGNDVYINHYPKLSWIDGGVVLMATGHVEAGKLFNVTLMVAAGAEATAAMLLLTSLGMVSACAVGMLVALNPVILCQITNFYVDGALAAALTVMVAGLLVYGVRSRGQSLAIAMIAACLVANLKLTGLAYVVVLVAAAIPVVGIWRSWREAVRLTAAAVMAGIVGVLLLGYSPYVRNVVEHGDPFFGAPRSDIASVRPANMNSENRVFRFLTSSFSHTESARTPDSSRLKFPLAIARYEARTMYGPGIEVGGFGPLYGAAFLLAATGALALLLRSSTRRRAAPFLVAAVLLLASMFVHGETWWARYVPQAWLVPILIAVASLESPRLSGQWWLGTGVMAVLALDVLLVSANIGWDELRYVKTNAARLQELSEARQPVTVYLGSFRALRQRLREAGVQFRIIDTPQSPPAAVRHALPAPGHQAFWFN